MFVPFDPGVSNITDGHSVTEAPVLSPAAMPAVSADRAGPSMYMNVLPESSTTAPQPRANTCSIWSLSSEECSMMSTPSTEMFRSWRR